jgi:hypothetical protein
VTPGGGGRDIDKFTEKYSCHHSPVPRAINLAGICNRFTGFAETYLELPSQ